MTSDSSVRFLVRRCTRLPYRPPADLTPACGRHVTVEASGAGPNPVGSEIQAAVDNTLAQWLHFLAATGRSSDRHSGHVLVSPGGPNTLTPRFFM